MGTDLFIPIFGLRYLAGLIAFLTFLGMIPRVWRVLIYTVFCAIHIFVAGVFHCLNFINRNIMSGLRQDIEEHNALRRRTYALIAEKRAQGVTARQIADAIGENLKEYHSSYENRKYENESVARLLSALRNLTPLEKAVKK